MTKTEAEDGGARKAPTTLGRRSTEGAWVTYSRVISYEPGVDEPTKTREYSIHVHGIYADKDEAGDAIIDGAGDDPITVRRVFVPWGMQLDDVLKKG
jgi:hypothetical protein